MVCSVRDNLICFSSGMCDCSVSARRSQVWCTAFSPRAGGKEGLILLVNGSISLQT